MDYPNSVSGVGLLNGKFANEDASAGRPGTLIVAEWLNAVTDELLNVIQAAGLEPNEVRNNQLLEAIRALVPERSAFARVSGTLALPATAFGIYALADGGAAATVTLPSTADLVDDTELLLFANHANTAAVQVKAAMGQTVQGPAALMGESSTAFMLPAGGDWVRLRSERAQGRWVVAAVGLMGEVLLNRGRIAVLENFEWKHKSTQRIWGATYTNGSKTRRVMCGEHSGIRVNDRVLLTLKIDDLNISGLGSASASGTGAIGNTACLYFEVPPYADYSVSRTLDGAETAGTFYWMEAD